MYYFKKWDTDTLGLERFYLITKKGDEIIFENFLGQYKPTSIIE